MHIPDGYISQKICIIFFMGMLPVWAYTCRQTLKHIDRKYLPVLAVATSFSFTVMMFRFSIVGEIYGHAIGSGILSIVFGPWVSALVISLALLIQATLFNYGGLSTFAINSFTIGYVASFSAYYCFKLLAGNENIKHSQKVIFAGISGLISIIAASCMTALIFEIQRFFFNASSTTVLYLQYSIKLALNAILFGHLFVFSWLEAGITALSVHILDKDKSLIQLFLKKPEFKRTLEVYSSNENQIS